MSIIKRITEWPLLELSEGNIEEVLGNNAVAVFIGKLNDRCIYVYADYEC